MTIENWRNNARNLVVTPAGGTQQRLTSSGERAVPLAQWREAQRRARCYLQEFGLPDAEAAALTATALRMAVRRCRASPALRPGAAIMAALELELTQALVGRAGFFYANSDRVQLARWRAFASLGGLYHSTPAAAQESVPVRTGRFIEVTEAPSLPSSPLVRRCCLSPRPLERNAALRLWRWAGRILRRSIDVMRDCCCGAR